MCFLRASPKRYRIMSTISDKRPHRWRLCLVIAALGVAALLSACEGEEATPVDVQATPSAVSTAGVAPTPTAVPLDLGLAREYQRNGQYEDAIVIYTEIVSRGSHDQRQQARLALARIYLFDERYGEARDQMSAYVEEAPEDADLRQARFLLARALDGLGENEEAVELYGRYLDEGGIAAPYARLETASILAAMGRLEEASQEAEAALAGGLPESLGPAAILSLAQAFEAADAPGEAGRWYERLFAESPSTADKALALWRQGAMKRLLDDPGWTVDLQTVVATYPATSAAAEALDELMEADEAVDPYLEGLVYYRHFRNQDALEALGRSLEGDPYGANAVATHYYLAATYERLGDEETAIAEYAAAYQLDPTDPLADDALWWRARLTENEYRYDEASEFYERLSLLYPSSDWAGEAAFRGGLVLYKQDRFFEAANAWRSAASTAPGTEETTRAILWTAKAELANGDEELGWAHLQELSRGWPLDYYGLRAAVLLSEGEPASDVTPTVGAEEPGESDDAQSWLVSVTGEPPIAAWTLWLDPHWVRGQELLALGLPRQAAAEFRALMNLHGSEPMALWTLARSFLWLGQTEMSARSAQLLLDQLPSQELPSAPREVLRLAYPQDYVDVIESAAAEEGVSSLVMLALIRQESFFDPLAGSVAGALGLTQVIPSTGRDIARELGQDDFSSEQLFRPAVSILFGAHYLANQLSTFDGNLYYALAAYNGGPGNALRWQAAAGDDVDLFLEEMDLAEPSLYVRRVMGHLAFYRYLYGGAPQPSLPQ